MTDIPALRERVASLKQEVAKISGSLEVKRANYEAIKQRAKAEFGVDTPDQLEALLAKEQQRLDSEVALLEQALNLYDSGRHDEIKKLLGKTA